MLCNHTIASMVFGVNPLFLEGLHIYHRVKICFLQVSQQKSVKRCIFIVVQHEKVSPNGQKYKNFAKDLIEKDKKFSNIF